MSNQASGHTTEHCLKNKTKKIRTTTKIIRERTNIVPRGREGEKTGKPMLTKRLVWDVLSTWHLILQNCK